MYFKFTFLSLLFCFTACKNSDVGQEQTQNNEQLYKNGKIYTVNSSQPWTEAMLVSDGVIIAIGSESEVESKASENAEVVNLEGKMVMPGIHDVHVYPLEAASENFQFTLNQTESDPENYASAIQQAVNQNVNAEWILGWGFDIYTVLDATRSPIEILDDISTTKPIAVMEVTSPLFG